MQKKLHNWYKKNKRDLPWRNTKDAYTIWLSEIILQQTRIDQGLPYFNKFLLNYTTVIELANATEKEILKLWQGLGYYSRARNMHQTAIKIKTEMGGNFPSTFDELKKLKGIGDYTAAAVSSFAFGEAKAVVDGNVQRVLSRFFGIKNPINSSIGKKVFFDAAQKFLDKKNPALHNLAMMELGSLVCKPQNPNCLNCPLQEACFAFENNSQTQFPVKAKKLKVRNRYFHYVLIQDKNKTFIRQRIEKDIWQNLFEFPIIEFDKKLNEIELLEKIVAEKWIHKSDKFQFNYITQFKHQLSHQTLFASFWQLEFFTSKKNVIGFEKINWNDLEKYAVPRLIEKFLESR